MLKRKKSLRDYCRDKAIRECAKTPQEWPKRTSALGRQPKLQSHAGGQKRVKALPKKALRRQSKRMADEMSAYYGQRNIFLERYPVCAACLIRGISPAPSSQVHHFRGRQGRLLRDERWWIAICGPCHDFVHSHPRDARRLGLLSSATEFNTMPR